MKLYEVKHDQIQKCQKCNSFSVERWEPMGAKYFPPWPIRSQEVSEATIGGSCRVRAVGIRKRYRVQKSPGTRYINNSGYFKRVFKDLAKKARGKRVFVDWLWVLKWWKVPMGEIKCRKTALRRQQRQWMTLHGSILVKKTKVMMMMTQRMTPFLIQRHQQRKRGSGIKTNLPSLQNAHIASENLQISNITSTSNIHRFWNEDDILEAKYCLFSWRITSVQRVATVAISRQTWRGTSQMYFYFILLKVFLVFFSVQVHQKQRRACPVCGKRYSDLRQHIRLVHEGRKVTSK